MTKKSKPKKKPYKPRPSAVTRGVGRPIIGSEQNGKIQRRNTK